MTSTDADFGTISRTSGQGGRRYFAMVPNMAIEDQRLSPSAFRLYCYFVRVCNQQQSGACFKAAGTIATDTGVSPRQQQRARAELVAAGYITVIEREGQPVEVALLDEVWDENNDRYRLKRTTPAKMADPPSAKTAEVPGQNGRPTPAKMADKEESQRDQKKRDLGERDQELRDQLAGAGAEAFTIDGIFELMRSKGYNLDDQAWIIRQGLEHRATSGGYYRKIIESNPPGIVEREELRRLSAERKSQRPAPPTRPRDPQAQAAAKPIELPPDDSPPPPRATPAEIEARFHERNRQQRERDARNAPGARRPE